MRMITLISDGEIPIRQQVQWSGYGNDTMQQKIQIVKDLQSFIILLEQTQTLQDIRQPKENISTTQIKPKKEQINNLLDEFNRLQSLPDELPPEK